MNKLKKIDSLKEKLNNLRPLNKGELERIREEFIINNTYNSNAIEGNTITLRETALIINQGVTVEGKPLKDHLDIIGYKDAFEYVTSLVSENIPLSERVIKEIHSLVLMNDKDNKGTYRKVEVKILGSNAKPSTPSDIAYNINKLLNDYSVWKKGKHIIQAVSLLHLEFESIHPFIDGNGRTGRLILNLELMKAGLLPIDIKFSDKIKYYNCFDSYDLNKNDKDMTDLIISYEIEELEKYINLIDK